MCAPVFRTCCVRCTGTRGRLSFMIRLWSFAVWTSGGCVKEVCGAMRQASCVLGVRSVRVARARRESGVRGEMIG